MINDCLSPGITLASVRSSNSRSFCCLSNQARCTSNDVVTGTLRRLQGRKAGQCRLHGYSPTAWWLGKAKGMAWNTKRRPVVSSRMLKRLFHQLLLFLRLSDIFFQRTSSGYIVKGSSVTWGLRSIKAWIRTGTDSAFYLRFPTTPTRSLKHTMPRRALVGRRTFISTVRFDSPLPCWMAWCKPSDMEVDFQSFFFFFYTMRLLIHCSSFQMFNW